MKKILYSLVMIAVVSAVAIGATRAYFTADYTAEDNTFATGTLSFDLRGNTNQSPEIPVNAQNMVPEVKETTYFNVYNYQASPIDIKYYLYADRDSGNQALYNKLKYSLYRCDAPLNLFRRCDQDGSYWRAIEKDQWLSTLTDANNGTRAFSTDSNRFLAPGKAHQWKLELWLDKSAGNTLQGKSVTFDLVGHATQSNNPGWSE